MTNPVRRLAAIMFTDIVGYTAIMQRDEAEAANLRARHRQVFEETHRKHHGEIIQYFGDGTLSVFSSGVEAVQCALAIQQALSQAPPLPLRIGLHLGDIVFDGTDVYGDGVNVAARIESLGVAGSILLSGSLNRELRNHPDLPTKSLGEYALKNVAEPVAVFALSIAGIKTPKRSELKGKQANQTKSIAVLPFVNMSADPDNEYFSDGMTEEIINALARIKELRVTSRTSSFFFKKKNIPIRQIGRELNVASILEGSVRLAGNRLRITAQLIDVGEDYHFWSETFDRTTEDLFAVQDEISLLIADKLREQLGHLEIEEHLVETPDISVETYKRYLKGRYLVLKMSRSEIDQGMALFEQVIEEAPHYPLAQLGMHLGYTLLGTIGLMPSGEAFARGQPYLDKALELAPELPECQLNLAWTSFLQDWDPPSAYRHLNTALQERGVVDYYQTMASILVAEGKGKAALHYLQTAFQLDPFSEINYHLRGFVHYTKERYQEAIADFEQGIQLKANFSISSLYRGQALIAAGRPEEALAAFEALPEDEPGDILKLGGTTLAHAALGYAEQAMAGIRKLEKLTDTDLVERATNLLILSWSLLGDEEKTLATIQRALELHLPLLVYLPTEPLLKPLRGVQRFQDLMSQILKSEKKGKPSTKKYQQTLFSDKELDTYRHALSDLMAQDRPYLDPKLSLRALAERLDLPANHLSQLLNKGFGQNFAEFVNTYRLEAFKQQVADPGMQHLSLLGLALESGFNSKTVFNTFFKKKMGMTPTAYWKSVTKE